MAEWRPIETAPKFAQLLLWHPASGDRHKLGALMRVGFCDDWPNRKATHWMPLPAPPNSGKDNAPA